MSTAPAFVHGYPFEAWLADRGRATPADAAALVASLATQVQAARAVGVGPGQAVPALVRIDASGAPVVDVWTAPTRRKASGDDASALRGRFGPPPGETLDERSDVYVLGVVLHHLLVGHFPFAGSNPVEAALAHRHDAAPAPSRVAPGVPEVLDTVVLRCLAKDPGERFATPGELADKLTGKLPEALVEPLPPSIAGEPLPPSVAGAALPGLAASAAPRARPPWGLVAAVVAIASSSALGWSLARPAPHAAVVLATAAPAEAVSPPVSAPAPIPSPAAPPVAAPRPAEHAPSSVADAQAAAPRSPAPATAARPSQPPPRRSPPPAKPEPRVAAPPSPAPAPAPVLASDTPADVTRLLAEGDALLRQKKYLGGAEDGALDRYRQVLALAPEHREARAKVALIRDTYLRLAHERRERGDFDAAHRYLSALDRAFAGDPEISAELLAVDADRAAASRSGHVAIEVRPWGNVFVDGKFVDQTPMPPLELAAGAHTIDVEGEQGRRRSVQVTVHGGESQRVAIDLARNDG